MPQSKGDYDLKLHSTFQQGLEYSEIFWNTLDNAIKLPLTDHENIIKSISWWSQKYAVTDWYIGGSLEIFPDKVAGCYCSSPFFHITINGIPLSLHQKCTWQTHKTHFMWSHICPCGQAFKRIFEIAIMPINNEQYLTKHASWISDNDGHSFLY